MLNSIHFFLLMKRSSISSKKSVKDESSFVADFSMRMIKTFMDIKILRNIKNLDCSWNKIQDFENFVPGSKLETLIVDGNPILSFRNFPQKNNLIHFSAINTPISTLPHFREICLLVIGPQLQSINGIDVTENEKISITEKELMKRFPDYKDKNIVEAIANMYRNGEVKQIHSIEQLNTNSQEKEPASLLLSKIADISHLSEDQLDYFYRLCFDEDLKAQELIEMQEKLIEQLKVTNSQIVKENTKMENSIKEFNKSKSKNKYNEEEVNKFIEAIKIYIGKEDSIDYDELLSALKEKIYS